MLSGSSIPQRLFTLHTRLLSGAPPSLLHDLGTDVLALCDQCTTSPLDQLPMLRLLYLARLAVTKADSIDIDQPLWQRLGPSGGLLAANAAAWSAVAAIPTARLAACSTDDVSTWLAHAVWMAQHDHEAPQHTALAWMAAMQGAPAAARLRVALDVLRGGRVQDAACEAASAVLEQVGRGVDLDELMSALLEAVRVASIVA